MTDAELIQAVNDVFADSFEIPREKLAPKRRFSAIWGWTAWTWWI